MSHKFLRVLVLFIFLAAVPFLHCDQKILTILHTNDTHSNLFPLGPNDSLGGIARMSTLIKELKAKDRNVLTLNAGDVFVGTFEFNKYLGYPELKIMQGLYDAMELGNHEFDLGTDVLIGVLSGVMPNKPAITMPVICANIDRTSIKKAPDALLALVQPSIIKEIGGLKVGITGVVNTEAQNYSSDVFNFLTDPFVAAGTQAGLLKAAGCDVVICVSHLGLMTDEMGLSTVPNIDIIISGHSHDALISPVLAGGKIIVQAGEFGKFLGELKVKIDTGGVSVADYKLHKVDWRTRKDPHLLLPLAALRVGLVQDPRFGPVLGKFVAQARLDMEKSWPDGSAFRDTAVGDLVADALRWGVEKAGHPVDIALEALGYVGSKIYKGKVVGEDVMRVVPYGYDATSGLGFKIVIVPLTGMQILQGLEFSVFYIPLTYDMSMQPSGLTFNYDSLKPAGARVDYTSVKVNGSPINPLAPYNVAMNEQVYRVLKSLDATVPDPVSTGLFEYRLVRDYMKKLIHVGYISEGRVIDQTF